MINMKSGIFLVVALTIGVTGCGDSTLPESEVLPVETTETPAPLSVDSTAALDSIARAQADSIAAAATTSATPTTPAPVGTPAASGTGSTIWDGVYTTAQANTGREIYDEVCSLCHTLDQWQDPGILTRHGTTLGGLFGFISDQMPQTEPGSLFPQDYAAVVAYMLSLSGVPTGNQPLPTTYQAMDRIRVTPRP